MNVSHNRSETFISKVDVRYDHERLYKSRPLKESEGEIQANGTKIFNGVNSE